MRSFRALGAWVVTMLILKIVFLPFPVLSQTQTQAVASPSTTGVQGFRLEDGTPIQLKLTRTISSATAQVNDRVNFEVIDEIRVNGVTVIPKGGIAWGTVTEAQPKRRMGRGGKLNVNIDSVRLADGEKAALRAVKDTKGGGHVGAMTGAMVATGIVFFPAAPLFLFMHGKDITIPEGTEITAYINGDMALDRAKFAPTSAVPATAQSPTAEPATHASAACTVIVKSAPDGADITVDGKYMGNTPSTIHILPGDHVVSVEKSGFKSWQRTITVTTGSDVTVDATLTCSGPKCN